MQKSESYNGSAINALLNTYLEEFGIESTPQVLDDLKKHFMNAFFETGLSLSPGIDKLFAHLRANDIPMAIATDGSEKEVQALCKAINGFDSSLFSHMVCGERNPEVVNNKPAPDIYLVCANKFAEPPKSPQNCVIFEDSLKGIRGAVASGMKTVLINDSLDSDYDSLRPYITGIIGSFEDFRPESVGLPPYPL